MRQNKLTMFPLAKVQTGQGTEGNVVSSCPRLHRRFESSDDFCVNCIRAFLVTRFAQGRKAYRPKDSKGLCVNVRV